MPIFYPLTNILVPPEPLLKGHLQSIFFNLDVFAEGVISPRFTLWFECFCLKTEFHRKLCGKILIWAERLSKDESGTFNCTVILSWRRDDFAIVTIFFIYQIMHT